MQAAQWVVCEEGTFPRSLGQVFISDRARQREGSISQLHNLCIPSSSCTPNLEQGVWWICHCVLKLPLVPGLWWLNPAQLSQYLMQRCELRELWYPRYNTDLWRNLQQLGMGLVFSWAESKEQLYSTTRLHSSSGYKLNEISWKGNLFQLRDWCRKKIKNPSFIWLGGPLSHPPILQIRHTWRILTKSSDRLFPSSPNCTSK